MFNILLIITISLSSLYSKVYYENIFIDEVISIYDGDTFRVNINKFPSILGENISVRVNGIDTPEIRGKCLKEKKLAIDAKDLSSKLLLSGKSIELRNLQRGKYFRIVADVYIDGVSLGNILLNKNLAVKYEGKKKIKDWCKNEPNY